MIDHPLVQLFREMVPFLDRRGIPYAVMGGMAVRIWALPRPTYDLDFTLSVSRDDLVRILRELASIGFTVPEPFLKGHVDTVQGMEKVTVQKYAEGRSWDVDLFLVSTPYQEAAFPRRRYVETGSPPHWVMSPEDLILHKLFAGRPRDVADVDEILFLSGPLDLAYMRRWAAPLGVAEVLEERVGRVNRGAL